MRDYLKSVSSLNWTTTSAKRLLTNEVYKGVLQFGDWRKEDAWQPIIEAEIWQTVQEAIEGKTKRAARTETVDDYTYYLRGRVVCPHCGCGFTQVSHHGKTTRVHYYVCQKANRRENCPVGRVNADRLHFTVLDYMRHAATHWTVMRKLISESGGWGNADDAQKALRGQLGKQKQMLEMRIVNYVKAIGDGKISSALMAALDKAEAEKEAVCAQIEQADQAISEATIKRPTTGQVQESWTEVLRVWEVLTEEERADLLGSVVQVVEMTQKESVTLELLPMPHSAISYSNGFALKSQMGAGGSLNANPFAGFSPLRDTTPLQHVPKTRTLSAASPP